MFIIFMRGCYVIDYLWNDLLDLEVVCLKESFYFLVFIGWIGIKNNGFCGVWKMGYYMEIFKVRMRLIR